MAANSDLAIEIQASLGVVHFNQPDKANALSDAMMETLCDFIADAAAKRSLRALLLTGSGRHFCAGADLRDEEGASLEDKNLHANITFCLNRLILTMVQAPFPIVAAVNGSAAGAGAGIALAADFITVTPQTQLFFSFAHLGLAADAGVSWFLPQLLGTKKATSILMRGEKLDGKTLIDLGIAEHIYQHDKLLTESMHLAQTLAKGPTAAFATQKRLLASNGGLLQALEEEALAQQQLLHSDDCHAALLAFRNGQRPTFSGR
jgi:2-(1,2-epoxy-1,2-dihydrophenyl)acetyl-CoA isomerase